MNMSTLKLAMRYTRYVTLVLLTCFTFKSPLCEAENLSVLVVLSDSSAPYDLFLKTFNQNLPSSIHSNVKQLASISSAETLQADLIITVGVKAAEWVSVRTDSPVLAAMLPSNTFSAILSKPGRTKQLSAIYLDQSWRRQAQLILAAFPDRKRIGVIYTPEAHLDLEILQSQLAEHDVKLVKKALKSNSDIYIELEEVLSESGVLLAVADSNIYNTNTIRNILLSSFRHGVPLVGLSQSYINAGGLCAVFSTPDQLAAQAAEVTISFAQARRLPEPRFPMHFSVAVNEKVGRALGLSMLTPESLRLEMDKIESRWGR
jgi:ABC-type uncharacterized transport system substrate-binding protein